VTDRPSRVAILYNAPVLPQGHPDRESEADVVAVARAIALSLKGAGFRANPIPASPPIGGLVGRLINPSPDVVFNLIEGFGGASGGEAHITGVLELLGLPYTGCPPESMSLGHSKGRTKAVLRGFGLPTASFLVVDQDRSTPRWEGPWPVIVKPEAEDASLGIDQGSVAESPEKLGEAVARLRAKHEGDILLEAYLPGREFNVGVIALPEPEALLVAEIVYDLPPGSWPILTYDAKWAVGSLEDRGSVPRCPASIDRQLAEELSRLAVLGFRAIGCRDYARVDFRLDEAGRPMILEVNPNPDIGPGAGWSRALVASGRDYDATLAALVNQAWTRSGRRRDD